MEKSNNPLKVDYGERLNYSHWKSRHVVKPVNVGKHSNFTSISAALRANKRPKDTLEDTTVLRSAFQTRKLKEQLQRRQVSLIVLVSHHRDGAAWNGGIT